MAGTFYGLRVVMTMGLSADEGRGAMSRESLEDVADLAHVRCLGRLARADVPWLTLSMMFAEKSSSALLMRIGADFDLA